MGVINEQRSCFKNKESKGHDDVIMRLSIILLSCQKAFSGNIEIGHADNIVGFGTKIVKIKTKYSSIFSRR